MIAWSIKAAIESDLFDQVIVSTDCATIAKTAESEGARVPFLRPTGLADHFTPTLPVVCHALKELKQQGSTYDTACCIYATAPFITSDFIADGMRALSSNPEAKFAFSVTSFPAPIHRAFRIDDRGRTEMFWPENETARSQDLPEAYHDAGQFYWGRSEAFCSETNLFCSHSIPVVIPRTSVQDIDTEEDWERAEQLFQLKNFDA